MMSPQFLAGRSILLLVFLGLTGTALSLRDGSEDLTPSRDFAGELRSDDRAIRDRAFRDLRARGLEAVPVLLRLLEDHPEKVRERAADLFVRLGEEGIPHVLPLLRSESVDLRFHGICILRDLGPVATVAVEPLARSLEDPDVACAMEAARALAQLREKAAPAVPALGKALGHSHWLVRVTVAGALASIGPRSEAALRPLIPCLIDSSASVRRAAADALAALGEPAWPAVEALVATLEDENLYVRIASAGALGSIGPRAREAIPALEKLAAVPGTRSEARWALSRIRGESPPSPSVVEPGVPDSDRALEIFRGSPGDWPIFLGNAGRNAVSPATDLPVRWDLDRAENVLWSRRLGVEVYGSPVVHGERIYIGADSALESTAALPIEAGTLVALDRSSGEIIWKDVAPRLGRGLEDFLLDTTTSTPLVEGDRLYYVTAQAQLRCLDTEGFRDVENDGPIRDEVFTSPVDADLIWELDFGAQLGVYPHEAPNCSVVRAGNVLLVNTSNGVDEAHTNVPAPHAPSFLGVDSRTGEVLWQAIGPGEGVLHGQWSSPSLGLVQGRVLAFFGGGDGWLYALDARTGAEVWRLDGNPADAVWRMGSDIAGQIPRNNIIACPVFHRGTVYLALGQDPEHGTGRGRLLAIDPGGAGDVTSRRIRWSQERVGRIIATPVVDGDLLYIGDTSGEVHCLQAADGKLVWSHDLLARIWSSLLVADGRLYVGDEDGTVTVFATGREKKILARNEMDSTVWAAPCAVEGVLYLPTATSLHALKVKSSSGSPNAGAANSGPGD